MSETETKKAEPQTSATPLHYMPPCFCCGHNGVTTIPKGHLVFAVPKKGRLYTKVIALLEGIGISFKRKDRLDIAHSTNMPISLVFLNAKDVATFVGSGSVDLGITGEDIIAEAQAVVKVEMKLQMGKCRLCLQAPRQFCSQPGSFFAGKRIATSFPYLTRKYFEELDEAAGVKTHVMCISGSVEAACGLGLADAVVDLVETGTTMRAAGLDVVDTIIPTETVLVSNPKSIHKDLIEKIVARIDGWLKAGKYQMLTYNIERSNLKKAECITPGNTGPTVMELAKEGWVAVQALVSIKKIPSVMEQLVEVGACGILATEVKNCRL